MHCTAKRGVYAVEATAAICGAGGLPPLIVMLSSTNSKVQRQAARALSNLALNGATTQPHFPLFQRHFSLRCASPPPPPPPPCCLLQRPALPEGRLIGCR